MSEPGPDRPWASTATIRQGASCALRFRVALRHEVRSIRELRRQRCENAGKGSRIRAVASLDAPERFHGLALSGGGICRATSKVGKCPDFVVNHGQCLGTDFLPPDEGEPGLSDQDKRALIAFLKTF